MDSWRSRLWYEANYWLVYTVYTFGFSYRSEGSHHVPPRGPVLLLANHESFLDPLAVGLAARRHIYYLARKTLFKHPTFGAFLRSVNCVPVDQEGVAVEGMRTCIEILGKDRALLVFPEGERSLTGEMLAFKPGISLILKRRPVPIVPVGVAGAYEAYPREARLPKLSPLFWRPTGAAIAASVGPVILPDQYTHLSREQLLENLFHKVQVQVKRAEKILRKRT